MIVEKESGVVWETKKFHTKFISSPLKGWLPPAWYKSKWYVSKQLYYAT